MKTFKRFLKGLCLSLASSCFAFPSVSQMTLEEKVGQILMVHFNGQIANAEAKTLIQKVHVGGIIYYNWANGLNSPEQVAKLSASLQKLSTQNRLAIPLFIAIDQEGGAVTRLSQGFTNFPGNKALGMSENTELAKMCAQAMGRELSAVGINFNFSPVVDVNSNPRNPVIGIRSFGDSPNSVISFAQVALEGYHKAGIITSLKHFPGHGDVEVDSHEDLPVIKKSKQQLQTLELLPFFKLAPFCDTVMTAHVLVPALDEINCATLSKDVLTILRQEMDFQGVIISDSLVMEGLLKNCASVDAAAIRALNAGCDLLTLGGRHLHEDHTHLELSVADIERIHQGLVCAVHNGTISEQRLDEAVKKVLELKEKYKLSVIQNNIKSDLALSVMTQEHQLLSKKVARLALKVIQNNHALSALHAQTIALFAPTMMQANIEQTSLLTLGKKNSVLYFSEVSPNDEEINQANILAEQADSIILCTYNDWKSSHQQALFHSLLSRKKQLIVLSLADTLDATLFPQAHLILMTFSPTPSSIQAACDYLIEK